MAKELANQLRRERKTKESSFYASLTRQLEQHTPEKQEPQENSGLYITTCTNGEPEDESTALQALRLLDCDSDTTTLQKLEQEQRDQELARKIQLLETSPKMTQEEIDKKLAMEAQDEGMAFVILNRWYLLKTLNVFRSSANVI